VKKPGLFLGIILIVFAVVLNCCEKEEDILPPFCNIEMPSDSSEFPFGDTITINVEAVDSNGYIKMVLFYIDDLAKFSTSSAPYQFKWSTLNEIHGFHIIRATAFDRSSNSSSDECIINLVINPPVVTTANISSITNNSAVCGGNIINNGGATVTARGVCWSTAPNPTLENAKGCTTDSTGTGPYISYLTGLSRVTKYYVSAYATNSEGTSYGEQVEFVTEPTSMAVTTSNVTSITNVSAVCGGEITDDGGLSVTERGVCWNTTGDPTLSDNYITIGTGTGTFSGTITGLSNKTKYYVRAYAVNSNGTKYGNTISFTTSAALPEVITGEVSIITCNSVQIEANVIDDGGMPVIQRGICLNPAPEPTIGNAKTTNGSGTGSFIANISGLKHTTRYYVRAYAKNSVGTAYGNTVEFTTASADLPTVETTPIYDIMTTTASGGGEITDDKCATVYARGICWSTSPNPMINDYKTNDGSETGSFTSTLINLEPNTTYYVRAYATNSEGTSYGNQVSFTTNLDLPTVITVSVGSITTSSAQIAGNVTDDGGATIIAKGVCWSTSLNPTISDNITNEGSGIESFISNIAGLSLGTTYYVRAYATNSLGTAYGDQVNFITIDAKVLFNTYGPDDSYSKGSGWTLGFSEASSRSLVHGIGFVPEISGTILQYEITVFRKYGGERLDAWLLNDVDNYPGALIEQFSFTVPSGLSDLKLSASSLVNPVLVAGKRYWLIVAPPDINNELFGWYRNPPIEGVLDAQGPSLDGPWIITNSRAPTLKIKGDLL
jgi:hypothetical protein